MYIYIYLKEIELNLYRMMQYSNIVVIEQFRYS